MRQFKCWMTVLIAVGVVQWMIWYWHLGKWCWGLGGISICWLPNGIAASFVSNRVGDADSDNQLLRLFYRAELIKWGGMLIALSLVMYCSYARLDLLLGYVVATLFWPGLQAVMTTNGIDKG